MFAPAYVGRKRRAKPTTAFSFELYASFLRNGTKRNGGLQFSSPGTHTPACPLAIQNGIFAQPKKCLLCRSGALCLHIMKLQNLQLGDVLLDTDLEGKAAYCMLWVNAPKAVAHSAEGNIRAVVRNFASDVFRESYRKSPATFHVHRYDDAGVAAAACEFAQEWASSDQKNAPPSGDQIVYSGRRALFGKTMRSRYGVPEEDWDVMSLFHPARALAKARENSHSAEKASPVLNLSLIVINVLR
jgi:hypothetical protein